MSKKLDFKGSGFDKSPLSDEELAQMRERSHHYDHHFLGADEFLEATGLKWAAAIAKGFPAFKKGFLAFAAIAAAYATLTKVGWL